MHLADRALSLPCCGLSARLCECNPIPSRHLSTVDHRGHCDAKPAAATNAGRGSGIRTGVNGLELGNTIPGASNRSGNASGGISHSPSARELTRQGKSEKYPRDNYGQLNSFNHGALYAPERQQDHA